MKLTLKKIYKSIIVQERINRANSSQFRFTRNIALILKARKLSAYRLDSIYEWKRLRVKMYLNSLKKRICRISTRERIWEYDSCSKKRKKWKRIQNGKEGKNPPGNFYPIFIGIAFWNKHILHFALIINHSVFVSSDSKPVIFLTLVG